MLVRPMCAWMALATAATLAGCRDSSPTAVPDTDAVEVVSAIRRHADAAQLRQGAADLQRIARDPSSKFVVYRSRGASQSDSTGSINDVIAGLNALADHIERTTAIGPRHSLDILPPHNPVFSSSEYGSEQLDGYDIVWSVALYCTDYAPNQRHIGLTGYAYGNWSMGVVEITGDFRVRSAVWGQGPDDGANFYFSGLDYAYVNPDLLVTDSDEYIGGQPVLSDKQGQLLVTVWDPQGGSA